MIQHQPLVALHKTLKQSWHVPFYCYDQYLNVVSLENHSAGLWKAIWLVVHDAKVVDSQHEVQDVDHLVAEELATSSLSGQDLDWSTVVADLVVEIPENSQDPEELPEIHSQLAAACWTATKHMDCDIYPVAGETAVERMEGAVERDGKTAAVALEDVLLAEAARAVDVPKKAVVVAVCWRGECD